MGVHLRIRMLARALLCVTLAGGLAALVQGQTTTLVEPPAPLLPLQFGKWVKAETSAPAVPSEEAPLLAEDGLRRSERGIYRSTTNPAETVTVTAYQLVDATGAHAAFSYFLRPGSGYRGPKIGDETGDGYLF